MDNPYKNRNLPVGKLGYKLSDKDQKTVNKVQAMLEFGEKELLYDIPRRVGSGNIANLGCSTGGSATLFALGKKKFENTGKVFTVDTYPKNNMQKALDQFAKNNVDDIVEICKGTTDDWFNLFQNENKSFKFIFIDACHSYNGVRSDFLNYSLLLKSNGYIAFHDTNQEYTDEVIKEFLSDWSLVEWVNRIKVFKR